MKVVNIRENAKGNRCEIMVVSEPGRFAKFFGATVQTTTYRGSGTVWHEFPSGERASNYMEGFLCDKYEAYRMKNDTSFST